MSVGRAQVPKAPNNPIATDRNGAETKLSALAEMKLTAWSKANGLTYQIAWRMRRDGKFRVSAEQLPTDERRSDNPRGFVGLPLAKHVSPTRDRN